MVTVEILEIEVLFCTYVWVTSYILMVEKAIKKGLFHTEQLFYMHVSEIIHPNSLLPYVCKKHNVSWPFLRKQQTDQQLQQDTASLQRQNELRSSRNPGNLPFRFFRVKHEWILAFFFQSGVENATSASNRILQP